MTDSLLIVVRAYAYKAHREKTRWELYKNTTNYLEQILEATPPQNNK